jgi:hypothetical protein
MLIRDHLNLLGMAEVPLRANLDEFGRASRTGEAL